MKRRHSLPGRPRVSGRGHYRRRLLTAAITTVLSVASLLAQPPAAGAHTTSATATAVRHYHWDDGHVRINVSYTQTSFVYGSAAGGPALIKESKNYRRASSPQAAYNYCSTKTTRGFIFTRPCLSDARNQLLNDKRALDRYLGPLTHCEAPIGRRLLQTRHSLTVAFASAASFYGYAVLSGYAGHYLPNHIGPHLTIQVLAGLLALVIIAQHFINVVGSRSPALPELLATIGSWFANSAMVHALSELHAHIGETIAAYFAERHQSPPRCIELANMV